MVPFKETANSKEELVELAKKGFQDFTNRIISKNDFCMFFGFTHGEAITKYYKGNYGQLLLDAGFNSGSEAYFSGGINAWINLKAGKYIFPPIQNDGRKITKLLDLPLQTIFYGAPGTGKSYKVKSEKLAGVPEENIFRTTFHPDYDYASFVGCYKPTKECVPQNNLSYEELVDILKKLKATEKDKSRACVLMGFRYYDSLLEIDNAKKLSNLVTDAEIPTGGYDTTIRCGMQCYKEIVSKIVPITYSFIPQVFPKAYVKAWEEMKQENPQPVYLVIEEINRGNCAQIFGDLFQLLDRKENGYSEYPIDIDEDLKNYLVKELGADSEGIKNGKFCLPPNLNLLATMNTSDQSLFPMDSAFKRRWDWEFVPIRYSKDEAKDEKDNFHTFEIEIGGKKYKWTAFLEKVNAKILSVTDSEDKQMGEYFIKKSVDEKTFINKVMYYLWSEVGKDMYNTSNALFTLPEGNEKKEFSFNELFKGNATDLLLGFMKKLEVKSEEEKTAEKAAMSATPAEV